MPVLQVKSTFNSVNDGYVDDGRSVISCSPVDLMKSQKKTTERVFWGPMKLVDGRSEFLHIVWGQQGGVEIPRGAMLDVQPGHTCVGGMTLFHAGQVKRCTRA